MGMDQIPWSMGIKVPLARAFIMNPEIIVMQRPLDHFIGREDFDELLQIIKANVTQRGLQMDGFGDISSRRPRTCFMSCSGLGATGEAGLHHIADVVIQLNKPDGSSTTEVQLLSSKEQPR